MQGFYACNLRNANLTRENASFLFFEKLRNLYFIICILNYGKITLVSKIANTHLLQVLLMMVFLKVSQCLVGLFTRKIKLKYGFLNNILWVLSNKAYYLPCCVDWRTRRIYEYGNLALNYKHFLPPQGYGQEIYSPVCDMWIKNNINILY